MLIKLQGMVLPTRVSNRCDFDFFEVKAHQKKKMSIKKHMDPLVDQNKLQKPRDDDLLMSELTNAFLGSNY